MYEYFCSGSVYPISTVNTILLLVSKFSLSALLDDFGLIPVMNIFGLIQFWIFLVLILALENFQSFTVLNYFPSYSSPKLFPVFFQFWIFLVLISVLFQY